jgi:hypothetical protein
MKRLILAAAMLASVSTAAMAYDPWMMNHNLTCQIPQYSLADLFRMISEYSATVGLPPPQVDYTTGAKNGITMINYTDPDTRGPGMILYFDSHALCERFRAAAGAWNALGRPALQ